MIKRILIMCLVAFICNMSVFGCDEASTTINSFTDNMNGTYTYNVTICVEFNGLEGSPDEFGAWFDGANVIAFTPSTVTTSSNDDYVGAINGIGQVYWTSTSTFPGHNMSTFCNTFDITVDALPTTLHVLYHDYPASDCMYSETLSSACSVSVLAGTQSACDPSTNTYSQDLTITTSNTPTTGNLFVNGQVFPVMSSPQTITLAGLTSDGNPVNVSIGYSDDPTCNYSESAVFTAPTSCLPCTIDNIFAGAQSACDPNTGTYSQDIIVSYSSEPTSGTLDVNGQIFPIGSSPQVVTLTALPTNGMSVTVTASFSADPACTFTATDLYTAPIDCTPSCMIDAITAGTPSACDASTSTFTVDITVDYIDQPSTGTLDINGQSFAIGISPQTETVTLPADGNLVDIVVAFSDEPTCTLTANDLFTAPGACIPVISGCSGTFTDSGGAFSDYDNNENIITSYCSGTGENLQFLFNPSDSDSFFDDQNFEIAAGDTLFVFDGVGLGGMPIDTLTESDDPGEGHFFIYSVSGCVTFQFISDNSGDDNGWVADYSCVPTGCGTNPLAADEFADAPYICNLDGFCGSTVGYTGDFPFNMTGGDQCSGAMPLFGGTIQNNSWVYFEAAATSITISVTIPTCYGAFGASAPNPSNGDGLQIGIVEFDGSNFTLVSDCASTDGVNMTSFDIVNTTPLTIGNTYYIMIDGNAGSECDYFFTVDAGSVTTVNAGMDQTVCNTDVVTLTATGPAGATYSWTGSDGSGPFTGATIMPNPVATTTYTVEVIGGGICEAQTDDVLVTVNNCGVCSIDIITVGMQSACDPATDTYSQTLEVAYTNAPLGGTIDINGQSFPNMEASPQTVTLTGLPSDGSTVNITAAFSSDMTCSYNDTGAFTAPPSCEPQCSVDGVVIGAQSSCDPRTDTYSQDITISYSNPPISGDLFVNGQIFPLGTSPQTVTLTGLPSDGNVVDLLISFTADNACTLVLNNAFTAASTCVSCTDGIQNGQETGLDCGGPSCPACPTCFVSQYYSGVIFSGIYQTSNYIGTNAIVLSGDDVSILASCLEMDPGFETQLGSEFLADPVPCIPFTGNDPVVYRMMVNDPVVASYQDRKIATVEYVLSNEMPVNLEIRSIDDSFYQNLIIDELKLAGQHSIQINLSKMNTGVYLLQLKMGATTFYKKIIIK